MCGRYVRKIDKEDAIRHFELIDGLDYFDIHGYKSSSEVFPGTYIFAIDDTNRPQDVWWTIEDRDQKGIMRKTINAKAENVLWANMFKTAFLNGRVLIPATSFYEWDENKTRWEFSFDEPIFAFGGIARDCEIKGEIRRCGVILTTSSNDVVRPIHTKDRMPVVIRKPDYQTWLDPKTPVSELKRLMRPLSDDETHASVAAAN